MARGNYKAFAAEGTTARQLEKSLNEAFSKMHRGGWSPAGTPIQVKDGIVIICAHRERIATDSPIPDVLKRLMGNVVQLTRAPEEEAHPPVRPETLDFVNNVMASIPPSDIPLALKRAAEIVKKIAPKLGAEAIRCLAEDIKTLQEHHKKNCDDGECNHQLMMASMQKALEEILTKSVS